MHLVMDNYATHKTPRIKAWLARRPHWHVHFTPTSASWIDQVERWFAELTRKQLQRGVHRSTAELEDDIIAFIEAHNENPRPYAGPSPPTTFSPPSDAFARKQRGELRIQVTRSWTHSQPEGDGGGEGYA